MSYHCCACGKEIDSRDGKAGRRETCMSCGADLHSCLNCQNFDEKSYNSCREPQADRVLTKDRSNYCDFFSLRKGGAVGRADSGKQDALKKLDDLFKK